MDYVVTHNICNFICEFLIQNIDVDQIVMEHYQSTSTPQPSISKFPPITPIASKGNSEWPQETSLPPELCVKCSHGFNVWSSTRIALFITCLRSTRDTT